MKISTLCATFVATSAMTVATAQTGSDSCMTPDPLMGQGSFAFDSTLATTGVEGQTETACYLFGSSVIDNDVWFSWTSDFTGQADIETCNLTAFDTKIAAYPAGGCPTAGTALACNDDDCGLQSKVSMAVTTGTAYMLQIGSFPGAAGGTGSVTISQFVAPPAPPEDDCTMPVAIAGQGSFPFDNTNATTGVEGQTETLCNFFGTSAVNDDVWYSWTSDFTGMAQVSTCGGTVDTRVAAYPGGGCPTAGTALACNDDFCGLQSSINFPVTNGTSYMLQIGTFATGAGGSGSINIGMFVPLAGDDCAAPVAIAGQGSFPYDNSAATTGIEGQAEGLCYFFGNSGIDNDVWFSWTADATGPATVSTCTSVQDTKVAAYPGGGCPTAGSSLACNDDSCGLQSEITFNAVAGTSYMLQVGNFPGGAGGTSTLDIAIAGPAEPGVGYCFCDSGNAPCGNTGATGNGCANGFDVNGANLTGSGTATVGADSLVLSASGLATGQPGLYFQGNNAVSGGAGIVFGDGIRCAGQGVIRLGVAVADGTGASDTSGFATAISVKGAVTAGDLRFYQLWYRDPAGSPCGALFNLTNGYQIQW